MCGRNLRFPTHAPSLFCDTIQFAIETDRSCHRQGPGAELRSGLFSLPQICAPIPADLNLPGSKKAPGRVPSFGLYHRLPQDSPSRIHAAERHTKTLHSSLFSLHSPRPGLPLPLPGKAREPPSAGAGNQFPGGNAGLQNALPPRTAPHAGHRLILNPCRRAAHQSSSLFPLPSSRPGLPLPLPGSARELLSAGGRRISSPAAMRDCKTPFPPAQPRMPGTGSF